LDKTCDSINQEPLLRDQFLFVKPDNCKKVPVDLVLTSKHLSIQFLTNQKQSIQFQLSTIFI
jgi:hypothetical protein